MPVLWLLFALLVAGQAPASPADIPRLIADLGTFDFPVRTAAASSLRRAPAAVVVPQLVQAAEKHTDEYVRFRAFVLLSGLDVTAADRLAESLLSDRNDRIRTAVYQWFEHHPRPALLDRLLSALPNERSEFVRPALTRAIAAQAANNAKAQAAIRPLVMNGDDLFRGSVIVALGEYGGRFAVSEITEVAALDGPLQDDAVTALGRLKATGAVSMLRTLQASGRRELQPTVSAALCLMGIDCAARQQYLVSTLTFAAANDGYQPLLRGAAHGLGMLATAGNTAAMDALIRVGSTAREEAQAPIALAIGTVAAHDPRIALSALDRNVTVKTLGGLLRDAFDMLSEDFEEEQFGTELRRALWAAPEGSPRRAALTELTTILEF